MSRAFGRGPGYLRGTGEKPRDLKETGKRLFSYLQPHKKRIVTVFILATLSTVFSILSPKITGLATTKIFQFYG